MADRTEREVLHHLVEMCEDGERGYRAAATYTSNPKLQSILSQENQRERIRAATERVRTFDMGYVA